MISTVRHAGFSHNLQLSSEQWLFEENHSLPIGLAGHENWVRLA